MSDIEERIAQEDWDGARSLILERLEEEPDSHWLFSRLALTYYEQRAYAEALRLEEKALRLAPRCPLVLWGYAGSLEMLDRTTDALAVYQRLVRRGPERIARGQCGEGLARARGLVADALYREAHCYRDLGDTRRALTMLERHLAARGPGCQSIYPIKKVRRELADLHRRLKRP